MVEIVPSSHGADDFIPRKTKRIRQATTERHGMKKLHPPLILVVLSVLALSPATSTLALNCPTPPSTTHSSSLSSEQRLICMRPFKIAQANEKVECLKYCRDTYSNCAGKGDADCKRRYDECIYACG